MRVYLGVDPETKELLYDLHPRRAATCSMRAAVTLFRDSEFGGRVRASSAATSSTGKAAVVGRRQLALAKCPCVQVRKASQCDCELCTQITLSLGPSDAWTQLVSAYGYVDSKIAVCSILNTGVVKYPHTAEVCGY